jgi:hypothetical protein
MPVADFAQGVQTPFFPMVRHANDGWTALAAKSSAPAQTASAQAAANPKSFWDNVLDVVNPLQHLPVVGTIYRSITGDKMGDIEKIAGDTLYGGPIGLASSLADVVFEKITGKDFEDTVLGLVSGGDKTTAVASSAKPLNPLPSRTTASAAPVSILPALVPQPAKTAQTVAAQTLTGAPQDANTQALMTAMSADGVNSDLGMRALFAYQKSMGLAPAAPGGPSAAP